MFRNIEADRRIPEPESGTSTGLPFSVLEQVVETQSFAQFREQIQTEVFGPIALPPGVTLEHGTLTITVRSNDFYSSEEDQRDSTGVLLDEDFPYSDNPTEAQLKAWMQNEGATELILEFNPADGQWKVGYDLSDFGRQQIETSSLPDVNEQLDGFVFDRFWEAHEGSYVPDSELSDADLLG